MNIETAHDQPTSDQDHPAMEAIVDPGYQPSASLARDEDDTDGPVAEVHDVVQEKDEDFVESAQDAVEDIRSESLVTNHFRV